MYSINDQMDRKEKTVNSKSPRADFFRSSLKSQEDLAFLKHYYEPENRMNLRESLNRPNYMNLVPKSTKADDRKIAAYFKNDPEQKNGLKR